MTERIQGPWTTTEGGEWKNNYTHALNRIDAFIIHHPSSILHERIIIMWLSNSPNRESSRQTERDARQHDSEEHRASGASSKHSALPPHARQKTTHVEDPTIAEHVLLSARTSYIQVQICTMYDCVRARRFTIRYLYDAACTSYLVLSTICTSYIVHLCMYRRIDSCVHRCITTPAHTRQRVYRMCLPHVCRMSMRESECSRTVD